MRRQIVTIGAVLVCSLSLIRAATADYIALTDTAGDLLLNKTVTAGTPMDDGYVAANATNGYAVGVNADYITARVTTANMAVNGFNAKVGTIRIWALAETTQPTTVTIKSSTNNTTSLVASDYENTLVSNSVISWTATPLGSAPALTATFDVSSLAVTGTQSLFFDFEGTAGAPFLRICELEAYAVPEPATCGMAVLGIVGILAYAWRKRR